MAVSSYQDDVAGGMVAGAAFDGEQGACDALAVLLDSGVRPEDLCVIAKDRAVAARVAAERVWYPGKGRRGILARLLPARLPREVRERYGKDLARGQIVVVAAAGGQPPDTLAALFARSRAADVAAWWQRPADLFAPPELAGPF